MRLKTTDNFGKLLGAVRRYIHHTLAYTDKDAAKKHTLLKRIDNALEAHKRAIGLISVVRVTQRRPKPARKCR